MDISDYVDRFAAVYAEAVLTFLDSGEPQCLTWDGESPDFDFLSVELDPPRAPVMLVVDAGWVQMAGDVPAVLDPDAPGYDPEELREAIQSQIADEGYGERLLKGFRERLQRVRDGEEEDDQDVDRDD